MARENAGAAAVEFALFLPFFVLLVARTFDLSYVIYSASQLSAAVNAGALYAANHRTLLPTSPATLQSNIQSVVENANGASWATSTVNVNNNNDPTSCYCPTGSPGNWNWGTKTRCGIACTGGVGVAGQFVAITASRNNISRSAIVETQ